MRSFKTLLFMTNIRDKSSIQSLLCFQLLKYCFLKFVRHHLREGSKRKGKVVYLNERKFSTIILKALPFSVAHKSASLMLFLSIGKLKKDLRFRKGFSWKRINCLSVAEKYQCLVASQQHFTTKVFLKN